MEKVLNKLKQNELNQVFLNESIEWMVQWLTYYHTYKQESLCAV